MHAYSCSQKRDGKRVGFVPTMGDLHHGHLSLFDLARKHADILVVSVFVNPTQFGPREDFDQYPRDLERDRSMCEERRCDALFLPEIREIYPNGLETDIQADPVLASRLCGLSRPGHFDGVTTVVYRLFKAVAPDVAFFGKKDFQQALIVQKMVLDNNLGIEIKMGNIIREADGLARSSRNRYLDTAQRAQAIALFQALELAQKCVKEGESQASRILEKVSAFLSTFPLIRIDYAQITDLQTLTPLPEIKEQALLALAAFVGQTRLIDNTVFEFRGEKSPRGTRCERKWHW